jgi:hypothetical protein
MLARQNFLYVGAGSLFLFGIVRYSNTRDSFGTYAAVLARAALATGASARSAAATCSSTVASHDDIWKCRVILDSFKY